MAERIGVFGGTFDPPHLGHLILASEAHLQLHLSRLLWVLSEAPPHKDGSAISPVRDRLAMVQLAIQGDQAFELSTVDMDRPGPHYTADTLALVREQNPGREIYLVIGGDSLHDLPRWHRPEAILEACEGLGVMRRPGDALDLALIESVLPGVAAKVHWIQAPLLDISSHEIRVRAREHRAFGHYVPKTVHQYILDRELYRTA